MGKKIADLLIKLGADTYGVTKMRNDVKKQLDGLGKDLQGFGKSMSLYVTTPLVAAAGASVHLADVQIRAEAKVQQAIKATGGAAKLNFEQLKKYASELQGKTVFGDEQILNESTAQLLTFTNIAGDNFKRVQQAALDVATVLDGDLKSTSIQLGKALNDPVKNLSALSRSGIQFSKDQITLIKSLAETNRLAEAQTIILDELNRQYGGQAEAAAKVGLGPLRQLKNSLGDLGEELGMVLMPVVQEVVGWVQNLVTWLQNLSPDTKTTIVVVGGLVAAIGPLSLGLGAVLKLLPLLKAGFATLLGPVGWVTAAIGALVTAILSIRKAKQDAFDDDVNTLVEKWSDGDYTPEQLDDLKAKKEAKRDNLRQQLGTRTYSPNKEARRELQEQIRMTEIEIEAIKKLAEIKRKAATVEVVEDKKKTATEETVGLIGKLHQKISELEKAKKEATSTYEIHNLNAAIRSTREELEELQNLGSKSGVANDTGNLFPVGVEPLRYEKGVIDPPESDFTEAKERLANNISRYISEAQGLVLDAAPMLKSMLADLGTTIGEGIGNILSGDGTFDDLLASIGQLMGSFLKTLGRQLIELGTMMIAIKSSLSWIFANPWAAIGIGVAAVAMGTALMNTFNHKAKGGIALAEGGLAYGPTMALVGDNRGAGSDPEVIAPLSKLRQYGLGRQAIEFVGGQFKLSGSDLLLAIRREDARITYVNALTNG